MESNFQKCGFLGTGAGGPRTEERVSGWRAKPIGETHEHGDWKVILLGVVVEHTLYNAEVVVQYGIMNSYVPCMGIQADWYRPYNTNQQITGQLWAQRALFSWHDLEIKFTVPAGGTATSGGPQSHRFVKK